MKISIIIPNFNSADTLLKNLPLILESGADETIIIDDGSTDKSVESIEYFISSKKEKRIFLLKNEKNLGFSSAVNRGIDEASGEIMVLLNTDVTPEKDFLDPLVGHFSNRKVFAVGCLDKSVEGSQIVLRGRGTGQWRRGFLAHQRGEIDKTDTLWVSCGSGAFRKDIWQKLGGLDPLYNPFYWEDIDLSYRAQKSGYKILFEPKSQVTHKHEEGIIKQNFSQFYIKTIAYRNQFFFVWKNISDRDLIFNHFLWLPYHLLKALISLDLAFWLGFGRAILRLPQVLFSRWKILKSFIKTDREILDHFYA